MYQAFPAAGNAPYKRVVVTVAGTTITFSGLNSAVHHKYRIVLTGSTVAGNFLTWTINGNAPASRGVYVMEADGTAWTSGGANGPGVSSIEGMVSEFLIMGVVGLQQSVKWSSTGDVGVGTDRGYSGLATWSQTAAITDIVITSASNFTTSTVAELYLA